MHGGSRTGLLSIRHGGARDGGVGGRVARMVRHQGKKRSGEVERLKKEREKVGGGTTSMCMCEYAYANLCGRIMCLSKTSNTTRSPRKQQHSIEWDELGQ